MRFTKGKTSNGSTGIASIVHRVTHGEWSKD